MQNRRGGGGYNAGMSRTPEDDGVMYQRFTDRARNVGSSANDEHPAVSLHVAAEGQPGEF